jgi:hypothetical protein
MNDEIFKYLEIFYLHIYLDVNNKKNSKYTEKVEEVKN